jgi:hypothetical protein
LHHQFHRHCFHLLQRLGKIRNFQNTNPHRNAKNNKTRWRSNAQNEPFLRSEWYFTGFSPLKEGEDICDDQANNFRATMQHFRLGHASIKTNNSKDDQALEHYPARMI